ncbi:MAG: hypothetical protein ACTSQJ_12920 [Promethearchaeota archaeon]
MAEKGFEPLTSQLGISGTSYRLQLGLINEKWASRILKGKDVIDSYVYKDEDISESGAPNQNLIVGWVLRTITLPNINPYGIMKTTQVLVKQALENKKKRKVIASVQDTKEIVLEKVPESELRRPKSSGWVKEENIPMQTEEDKRAAFRERLKAKKEAEKAKAEVISEESIKTEGTASAVKTVKTSRKLPTIPTSEIQIEQDQVSKEEVSIQQSASDLSRFCPYCGKDLNFIYCPFCGKKLPHDH